MEKDMYRKCALTMLWGFCEDSGAFLPVRAQEALLKR